MSPGEFIKLILISLSTGTDVNRKCGPINCIPFVTFHHPPDEDQLWYVGNLHKSANFINKGDWLHEFWSTLLTNLLNFI